MLFSDPSSVRESLAEAAGDAMVANILDPRMEVPASSVLAGADAVAVSREDVYPGAGGLSTSITAEGFRGAGSTARSTTFGLLGGAGSVIQPNTPGTFGGAGAVVGSNPGFSFGGAAGTTDSISSELFGNVGGFRDAPSVFNNVGGFGVPGPGDTSYFRISYFNTEGDETAFVFSLLPAVENYLSINNQGAKVPELKPGICINTKMKHRNIVVPGSTPVVQAIGPESTMMYLQGLFVGNEVAAGSRNMTAPVFTDYVRTLDAFQIGRIFNNDVILPSIPVTIDIYASSGKPIEVAVDNYVGTERFTRIKVRGLIQSFRNCTSRENRSYYAMDILLIDYIQRQRANPKTIEEVAAQDQEYAACSLEYEDYKTALAEYEASQQQTESPTVRDTSKENNEAGWFFRPNSGSESEQPSKEEKPPAAQPPSPISDRCMQLLRNRSYPGLLEESTAGGAAPKETSK